MPLRQFQIQSLVGYKHAMQHLQLDFQMGHQDYVSLMACLIFRVTYQQLFVGYLVMLGNYH